MLVLGVDPGTATTGYGLVTETEPGDLKAVDFGVITTPAGMPTADRLVALHKQLTEIVQLHCPHSCAVEKLFFQRNVATAMAVGEARGVILLTLAEAGISPVEYTPMEVKMAVTGFGAADKRQVQQMTKILLGLRDIPRPDDAADALALAICHLHSARLKALTSR